MSESHKSPNANTKPSKQPPSQGGLEKSAEQDEKSNQGPGLHGSDVEKQIGRNMPDRK